MYQIQAPAFNARSQILGTPTNSTPDTPPIHPPIDVAQLCALKKSVIANLPTTCGHCGAELPPRSIVEHDGSIMAYCKKPGACGRSQVLYAAVDFKTPVYKKVCIFTPRVTGNHHDFERMNEMSHDELMQMHDPSCANCGSRSSQHKKCDQNGWAVTGHSNLALPADWPAFDSSTGTWKEIGVVRSVFTSIFP
jgi:hypothetical protein